MVIVSLGDCRLAVHLTAEITRLHGMQQVESIDARSMFAKHRLGDLRNR